MTIAEAIAEARREEGAARLDRAAKKVADKRMAAGQSWHDAYNIDEAELLEAMNG